MSHVRTSHELCILYERVTNCALWTSFVAHMTIHELCYTHKYTWVMSHVWLHMSHVTFDWHHTCGYTWVMPHVRLHMNYVTHRVGTSWSKNMWWQMCSKTSPTQRHVTHMTTHESCHTYDYTWVMSHIWLHMSHITHMTTHESCHTYDWIWVMSRIE